MIVNLEHPTRWEELTDKLWELARLQSKLAEMQVSGQLGAVDGYERMIDTQEQDLFRTVKAFGMAVVAGKQKLPPRRADVVQKTGPTGLVKDAEQAPRGADEPPHVG
jgi:hypothetical protein